MKKFGFKINLFAQAGRPVLRWVVFGVLISALASAEIVSRLSPSPQRVLESAGATLVFSTPATVNGARATLGAYLFPAAPRAASAEAARLLKLPVALDGDGMIAASRDTRLMVLPASDPRRSLMFLARFESAPGEGRATGFPENLPRPDNAFPVFSATLDTTQTAFAAAVSAAAPEEVHADMRRRLLAQKWQPALPETPAQSMALYARGNAVFLVCTAPRADGSTRLALLQRLTSNTPGK
ncbi:MAG: hypothetical protein FWF96_04285 [Kiritimatiellaeota bacterium]|nr:hypothetical protein [Kiritimatiellota bacterium]